MALAAVLMPHQVTNLRRHDASSAANLLPSARANSSRSCPIVALPTDCEVVIPPILAGQLLCRTRSRLRPALLLGESLGERQGGSAVALVECARAAPDLRRPLPDLDRGKPDQQHDHETG